MVGCQAFLFQDTRPHRNSMLSENSDTVSAHLRIRIRTSDHNFPDPGLENGIRAWRLSAFMAAGFQCDIQSGSPAGFPAVVQSFMLGMQIPASPMPPFCDHSVVFYDHSPDHRIRRCPAGASAGQLQCCFHTCFVIHVFLLSMENALNFSSERKKT